MKTITILCVIATVLVSGGPLAAASSDTGQSRPRVGLVLGGGGARGAAHIGVLRELERQRIPVDAIAGTSMGAIVGGLYASGMTVPELEELVASLDWNAAFSDANKRKNMRYRQKQHDAAFPIGFEMGFRDSEFLLPNGIVQGQKLSLILRELTIDVADVNDFDDLPIPYRAVASDLASGEAVVLGEGDLAQAIRASMSAPGVFAPAELDGRILVDGGLVGNVPIEAIHNMDVDVVIAVDVEFPLYKAEELQSAISISAQMLTILIRKETLRQLDLLGNDDYLIRPQLGEFGSADFANITEAVEPGAVATMEQQDRLSTLAMREDDYRRHVASRQRAPVQRTLEFVRVVDDGTLSPRVLESRLNTSAGDAVDPARLAADADGLYGLQLFEQVDYRLVTEDGRDGVEFVARPKAWGPNFLQYRMSLQDNLEGDTAFNVGARLTRAGMNRLGAEWRTDLQLGTEPFVFSEFYQPLSFDSRYFIAPRVGAGQRNFNVFAGTDNLARYRLTQGEAGFDVGRELGLWGEVRLGVYRGLGNQQLTIGDPALQNNDFQSGGIFGSFNIDTLDNAQIPLAGMRLNVEMEAERKGMGADDQFETIDARYTGAWTGGRHTLNVGLRYATSRNSDRLVRNFFTLGGFLKLSGLSPGELSGPHAALARLVYYRRSGELKGTLNVPFYIGASLEAGNTWAERSSMSFDSALANGSLFLGADTFVGAVFLAAGFGEGGSRSLYLSVGNAPGLQR